MNNAEAVRVAETVHKMGNDRARLEHAVKTMLSRLGADESEITLCVLEAKSGSFAWVNKYLPIDNHDWECISSGVYDSKYHCKKCKKSVFWSIDNLNSEPLERGCTSGAVT